MPERTLRFQQKLWQIVNTCQSGAVFWSDSGDSIIFRFSQFKKEYLDRNVNFCKSNKIASFVRQLNLYGFRKLVKAGSFSKKRLQDHHEFQNAFFQRGRSDLLQNVVRSSTTPTIWRRSTKLSESYIDRSSRRGKRGRGRRKIKCKKTELDEADHCYGNLTNIKYPRDQKPVRGIKDFSAAKYSLSDLSNFENVYESKTQEKPKLEVPFTKKRATGDYQLLKPDEKANTFALNNVASQLIKSVDTQLENKNIHFEAESLLRTQPGQNCAYLDDDILLDSEKEDEDDEFYKALMESGDTQNYLNEPILFSDKEISEIGLKNPAIKFCSCNDCEVSEEYLELVSANARMRDTARPLFYCVCNSGIPPTWMFPGFPF